ncbi:YegS/Rv2252/BmrU family lipid kinase [Acholeplasma sp. OttesenSCG-928-E16]|nr:YegS/Rv2252/BmrU family lipid kinase [Acholeplasma sp. OttesenSCG-928-E16]
MKCLLIYNPVSGKGKFKDEVPLVRGLVEKKGHTLEVFETSEDEKICDEVTELASQYDVFLVAGGDGTLNFVINCIMQVDINKRPKVLLIPRGTCNDVAHIFGINKELSNNIDLLDLEPIKTDIGQINEKYFCYSTACGAFSETTYQVKRKDVNKYGYLAYIKEGIKKTGKNKKIPIKVKHDIGEVSGDFCLAIILNSKKVAGFTLRFYSEAKMNDGLLEMRLLKAFGFFNMLKIIFFFLFAGTRGIRDKHLISRNFEVEMPSNVGWNIDGEKGPSGNVFIKTHKEAIEFFVSERSKKKYYL